MEAPGSLHTDHFLRTIWEVALTSKESDGLGKHLGPLSPVGSQQQEADVWGWRPGGFQSAGVKDSPSLCLAIRLSQYG